MLTLEAIERRIRSAQDLHGLVRTMKTMAAVSIRHYERAVESLVEYDRSTELGLHVVLARRPRELSPDRPRPGRKTGVIVFGSDQGMCGPLNEQIVAHALEALRSMGLPKARRRVLAVGARAASRLEEAGQPVEDVLAVPGSVGGITPAVQELLFLLESWRAEREIDPVYVFYHRTGAGAGSRPYGVRLIPVHLRRLRRLERVHWPSPVLPIFTMEWEPLFSALLRQHLFVSLHRALAEALASESASRLASMQTAERNIEERLAELVALHHRQRQDAITSELLDIVSGFEVLEAQGPGGPPRRAGKEGPHARP